MTREHPWNTPPRPGNFTEKMKIDQERLPFFVLSGAFTAFIYQDKQEVL